MTQNGNNVIILGGYGAAGKAIASLLGKSLSGTITLAGRSIVKAQQMVIRLESDAGFQANLRAELVDVSDEAQARRSGSPSTGPSTATTRFAVAPA